MKQTITLEVDCDVDISGVLALYLIADSCGQEARTAKRYGCEADIEYTILQAISCAKLAKVAKTKTPYSLWKDQWDGLGGKPIVPNNESIGMRQPGNDNAVSWRQAPHL